MREYCNGLKNVSCLISWPFCLRFFKFHTVKFRASCWRKNTCFLKLIDINLNFSLLRTIDVSLTHNGLLIQDPSVRRPLWLYIQPPSLYREMSWFVFIYFTSETTWPFQYNAYEHDFQYIARSFQMYYYIKSFFC